MKHLAVGVRGGISFGNSKAEVKDGPYLTFGGETNMLWDLVGKVSIPVDRFAFYGIGGVTGAHNKGSISCPPGALGGICAPTPAGFTASSSQWDTGWIVGTGVEYALTRNASVSVEWNYSDFGSPQSTIETPKFTATGNTRATKNDLRVNLNVTF